MGKDQGTPPAPGTSPHPRLASPWLRTHPSGSWKLTLIFLVEPRSSGRGKETCEGGSVQPLLRPAWVPAPSRQPKSRQRVLAGSLAGSGPNLGL